MTLAPPLPACLTVQALRNQVKQLQSRVERLVDDAGKVSCDMG